jgi:uncharacterized protein YqhQ
MALRDGVMLQGPGHWAAAVRMPDGSIRVRSGAKTSLPGTRFVDRVPVARGLTRLLESVAVLPRVRRDLGRPVLPQEDPRLLAATVGSAVVAVALRRGLKRVPVLREAAVGLLTLAPALLALRDSELAAFHGAEHKSVGAYEGHIDPHDAAKEHDRCGANLIGPLLATNAAGGLLLHRLGRTRDPLATAAVGLLSLGSAVEVFTWMARHRDHPLAGMLRMPGLRVQRFFTTREPSEDQLDVAQRAMSELLRLEGVDPDGAVDSTADSAAVPA